QETDVSIRIVSPIFGMKLFRGFDLWLLTRHFMTGLGLTLRQLLCRLKQLIKVKQRNYILTSINLLMRRRDFKKSKLRMTFSLMLINVRSMTARVYLSLGLLRFLVRFKLGLCFDRS